MAFRYKRSVPVDYDRQGYIYFASRAYQGLPAGEQKRVRELCQQAGGEYSQALFEFVTTDNGASAVCMKHYLSVSTLERIVRRYYVLFSESL